MWKNHFGSKENDVSCFITRLPLLSQTGILFHTVELMGFPHVLGCEWWPQISLRLVGPGYYVLTSNISKTRLHFIFPASDVMKLMELQNLSTCWSVPMNVNSVPVGEQQSEQDVCCINGVELPQCCINLSLFFVFFSHRKSRSCQKHTRCFSSWVLGGSTGH